MRARWVVTLGTLEAGLLLARSAAAHHEGLVVALLFAPALPSEQANTIFEGIIRDYVVPALR